MNNNQSGAKTNELVLHRFYPGRGRILVQVTIYRRLLIGGDDHLDQSEAYDIS